MMDNISKDAQNVNQLTGQHPKTGSGYYYSPDVRYRYTVNGKAYNGNKVIAADYSSSSASRAGKITRQYKKGSNVNVYYNPENPGEAVLMPG